MIKVADVAKRVTVITKQRPQILRSGKVIAFYINDLVLRGDNICESFICEKALEIYNDLVEKSGISANSFEFKAGRG